jgi:S1-C subfamily serine protease
MGDYMHRHIRTLLAVIMTLGLVLGPVATARPAGATTTVITLTIGNPNITVNGTPKPIDASGTTPVIVGGRTLLPIRAIVEALGGTIGWNATTRTVTISVDVNTLELVIGNRMATVNGKQLPIDAANATIVPVIVGGRTMLPVRFVGEQLGGVVEWNQATKTATLTFMTGIELTAPRLLEPTDAALSTSPTVTFRWTPVTYATSYTLVITKGSTQVFRGVSTTTSFTPTSTVLAAGTYSWAVAAAAGSTTGPMSLTSRFTVKLPMSPADVVKAATPSIVEIAVLYADGGSGIAGAFFVDSSGIVVTTYEVIKGAVAGSLFLADDTELTSLRVLGYDPARDIAILKVPTDKPLPALSLLPASEAQVNQDVVMVSPVFADIPQLTVAGVVNTLTQTGFTVRGAAHNAFHGSPVLDQFGDVVGMVTTDIQPATGAFPAVSAATIRSVARTGDWTIREVTEREGTGLQALDAPTLAQPSGEATIGSLTPEFGWNTVAGATRYQFWVGEGRDATGEGIVSAVIDYNDPHILPGVLKPGTTYTWAVRAGNDNGWGPWSPDRMFTTSSSIVQPLAPAILEPLEGAVVKAAEPVLLWRPVTGASQYYVRVTLPNNDIVYETSTANTSVVVPAGTLTSGTAYLWTVRVENSSGISSLWVAPYLKFSSAIPTGIGVPSLLSPVPKAILSSLNPTLTWQAVMGATRYNLRILNDAGTTIVYDVIAASTSLTVPAGKLQPGIPYLWVVIAGSATNWSQTGSTWNWSLNRPFTINLTATIDITPPVLLAPVDGATLAGLTATLQWSSVQGATWYRVYLGKGTSESDLVQVVNRVVDPKAGDTQQYALSIGTLEAGSTYYWRVLAGAGEDVATPEFMHFTTAP